MRVRKFLLVLGLAMAANLANAQSSTDIALAKQLAKQQGYSDAQIEAMMSQYNKGGKTQSAAASNAVDRNAAAMQQQQMLMQQQQMMMQSYGVAGQPGAIQQTSQPKQEGLLQGADLIYGHNLFKNKNLNFVPSYNIPTPSNYKLSAGDEAHTLSVTKTEQVRAHWLSLTAFSTDTQTSSLNLELQ